VWTPGRIAADFATTNGDPNKIPKVKHWLLYIFDIFTATAEEGRCLEGLR
jgi:hypothetical protein